MLNSYPQSVGDLELGLRTYLAVCREFTDAQVSRTVTRFLTGKVERKNREFAPSCESFAVEVDAEAERERLEARRTELEAILADDLKHMKGDDGIPFDRARNVIERFPKSWRQKFIEQKGAANAQDG